MAGGDKGSQEKTEEPTPKRLRDARKKGQIWQSKDLSTILVLISSFIALGMTITYTGTQLEILMTDLFSFSSSVDFHPEMLLNAVKASCIVLIKVSLPIVITALVIALFISAIQVGAVFSMEPLKPQIKKLNMIEGLKNMFKTKTFVELLKNILKICGIFIIAFMVLNGLLRDFLLMPTASGVDSAKFGGEIISSFLIRVFSVFILVAILDVFFQRKDYRKNLKMSKDEVKREYKEDEGDPLIKSHRKALHREMAFGDVKQQVKNSDVVVTNPTHLAVALKYDTEEMAAPQLMAKGQRLFAEYIRELAKEYDVPIVQNIPLAWSLIELELEDEIPADLYQAVAEILTFVYQMKESRIETQE
jgi:flagellar biosynthesis protein FlhB